MPASPRSFKETTYSPTLYYTQAVLIGLALLHFYQCPGGHLGAPRQLAPITNDDAREVGPNKDDMTAIRR